jgi:hypothetical protein
MPKGHKQYKTYTDFGYVCPCGRTFDKMPSQSAMKKMKTLHSRFCEKAHECERTEVHRERVNDELGYAPPRVD